MVPSSIVDLNERRQQLEKLMPEGGLTEEEFAQLVQNSERAATHEHLQAVSETQRTWVSPKKMALLGVVALVVIVAALLARPSDPLKSKEYKELLDKKSSLETKMSSLKDTLDSLPDVSVEIADYERRVRNWNATMAMIQNLL